MSMLDGTGFCPPFGRFRDQMILEMQLNSIRIGFGGVRNANAVIRELEVRAGQPYFGHVAEHAPIVRHGAFFA